MLNEDPDIVMVTVASFPEAIEAHIIRNRLEADGIPCVIADENIITNQPWHSIAYGGVKLRVRQQDEARARTLLEEIRTGAPPAEKPACPACGSDNLVAGPKASFLNRLGALLWGKAVPEQIRVNCRNCGHQWITSA